MGRIATMSPLGLYQWDETLFDLMDIPTALDKSTLIDNLLSETAELEVLYPNPVVLKNLIGVWSAKQIDIWNRLYATTQYEYNPIENYDRHETGSEGVTGRTTHSGTDTTADTTAYGGSDTNNRQSAEGGSDGVTGSDTKGHWIAGFNSVASAQDDGLVKQTRDQDDASTTTTYGKTETTIDQRTYGQTIQRAGNMTHGEQIATTNEEAHTLHTHGNIGVTTTQTLIKEQRDIDLFNLYDIIIEDFKMRFCILVY